MASVNKAIIVGNLGADPETRYTASGDAVTTIRVATTDTWKDKNSGEKREATEWHRVVFYRKLAEIAGQYLKKGSQVYLECKIRTRKWQDKDGQDRWTTELEAHELVMLGGGKSGERHTQDDDGPGGTDDAPAPRKDKPKPSFDELGDDIPF